MKHLSILFLASLWAFVLFPGCNGTKPATLTDEEAPEIFMSRPVVMELGNFNSYLNGDTLYLDIRFEDDVELKEYQLKIRQNQNLNFLKTDSDSWEEDLWGDLDGKSDGINTFILVRDDPSAGGYDFELTVWDMTGKFTTIETYLFVTNERDTLLPYVTIASPDTAAVDTYTIGSDIPVMGYIAEIGTGTIFSARMMLRDTLNRTVIPETTVRIDTIFANAYTVDTFITTSASTTPAGDYILSLYGRDAINNWGLEEARIYLKN